MVRLTRVTVGYLVLSFSVRGKKKIDRRPTRHGKSRLALAALRLFVVPVNKIVIRITLDFFNNKSQQTA